jgi:hypothetical protein
MPANWAERVNITKAGVGASTTARPPLSFGLWRAQAVHKIEMISSEPLPRMTSNPAGTPSLARMRCLMPAYDGTG